MAEHLTVTPSGYRIRFEDGEADPLTGRAKRRSYTVNDQQLASVTTVLGILDKAGLKYAAEKLTVAGMIELAREGEMPLHVEGALTKLKGRELRFFQQWARKSDRGTVAHDDLLKLATGQELADLDSFPLEQQGFIRGVSAWYADYRPQVIDSEVMVASVEHGFAGRYDLCATLQGATYLVDLKTQEALPRYKDGTVKSPYPEHLLQVAAYALAREESGYGTVDHQAVVRVDAQGSYDFTTSWSTPEDFLMLLGAHRALKGLSERKPKRAKVAA